MTVDVRSNDCFHPRVTARVARFFENHLVAGRPSRCVVIMAVWLAACLQVVRADTVYPLRVAPGGRYLIDGRDQPFLLIGDAPQTLVAKMSLADASSYMANRRKYGVNTLWISALCNQYLGCDSDSGNLAGARPFTIPDDLTTPSEDYFKHLDNVMSLARENNMLVLLSPIETGGWMSVLQASGSAKAFSYGQYLGRRYAAFPNIIWLHGNDFQHWQDRADDELVQAVARGIRSVDPVHPHTAELNYMSSGTLDDPSWTPLVDLDAAYTYFPAYVQILREYRRPDSKPIFLVETDYEFEHLPNTDGGSPQNLRRQGYWSLLSGAMGEVYGSGYVWASKAGWSANLDTQGIRELGYMRRLLIERRWYDLIPDWGHDTVTGGYGQASGMIGEIARTVGGFRYGAPILTAIKAFSGLGSVTTNSYAATARTADGTLVMTYVPTQRPVQVDLSKLAGPTLAHWYDPTSGEFTASAKHLTNQGSIRLTPPGPNHAGDTDWVLVLEAERPG